MKISYKYIDSTQTTLQHQIITSKSCILFYTLWPAGTLQDFIIIIMQIYQTFTVRDCEGGGPIWTSMLWPYLGKWEWSITFSQNYIAKETFRGAQMSEGIPVDIFTIVTMVSPDVKCCKLIVA